MLRTSLACLAIALAFACGGGSAPIDPDTDEFDVDPGDQTDIDAAAASGDGAEGSYSYDDVSDTLTITIAASTFECGIIVGTIVATVVELTATTMVWEFVDDDGGVTWTRVDNGTSGVVGIWRTDDPDLYLILSADGDAQIFGEGEVCDDDRPRNDEGCFEIGLTGVDITIDGDLAEWSSVAQSASISDDADDYLGSDDGADLRAMKVEFGGDTVYVLTQLYNAPSTAFQADRPPNSGAYRLTVAGTNGLSLVERAHYDPIGESWAVVGDGGGKIAAAVGTDGIEWSVDVSDYVGEGFTSVDLILIETLDCVEECGAIDYVNCGYFAVPQ